MCMACGMDEDDGLWLAYQAYLEKRGLTDPAMTPLDAPTDQPPPNPPAPTTFTCDET